MRSRVADLARGLLALAVLLALVVGVPIALVAAVGWPLPTTLPTLARVLSALRYGQVADTTLIKILAVLVWAAWAQLTVSVAIEAVALAQGRIASRVPGTGAMQQAAARLVPAALLVFTSFSARSTPTLAHAAVPEWTAPPAVVQQDPIIPTAAVAASDVAAAGQTQRQPAPAPSYEVQRGDTLWDLAERLLGDGHRWREIRDLNVGRLQPDGSSLAADEDLIRRGWLLVLPAGAARPGEAGSAPAAGTVTVQPGDTLSAIAERAYGDADRYPTIFDANRGRPQPDGDMLDDPDLIRPGWRLDLPSASDGAEAEVVPDPVAADGRDDLRPLLCPRPICGLLRSRQPLIPATCSPTSRCPDPSRPRRPRQRRAPRQPQHRRGRRRT